jgi:hypothetical protein
MQYDYKQTYSAGHIQRNFVNAIAFSPHGETRQYFESSGLYHVLSGFWLLSAHFRCKCSFAIFLAWRFSLLFASCAAVALSLLWLIHFKPLSLQNIFRTRFSWSIEETLLVF